MQIEVTRTYTIDFPGSQEEFINLIREELALRHDTVLVPATLEVAAYTATQCWDGGDLTTIIDETDYSVTVKEQ